MSQPMSPQAFISYAREDAPHDAVVRALADQLRHDGVDCELDQYVDAPHEGWPSWIADRIFDDERFILVIASSGYLRRWLLAERCGVGLGVKYEGKLLRQVLYSEDGLTGRVIPVLLNTEDKCHVPPELRDTHIYDVRPDSADPKYDALLRRLTAQPVNVSPSLGKPVSLLAAQTPRLASLFFLLQHVPAPFPIDMGASSRSC